MGVEAGVAKQSGRAKLLVELHKLHQHGASQTVTPNLTDCADSRRCFCPAIDAGDHPQQVDGICDSGCRIANGGNIGKGGLELLVELVQERLGCRVVILGLQEMGNR